MDLYVASSTAEKVSKVTEQRTAVCLGEQQPS